MAQRYLELLFQFSLSQQQVTFLLGNFVQLIFSFSQFSVELQRQRMTACDFEVKTSNDLNSVVLVHETRMLRIKSVWSHKRSLFINACLII